MTPKDNRRQTKAGFTLLELIISSVLISLVLIAVYAAFSTGLKIWAQVNQRVVNTDQAVMAFERLTKDLHNTVSFTPISFTGTAGFLSFPILASPPVSTTEEVNLAYPRPARVNYSFDAETGTIVRAQTIYGLDNEPISRTIMTAVKSLTFSYRYFDTTTNEWTWQTDWNNAGKPSAVKVDIILNTNNNKNETEETLTRTINLPVR